MSLLELRIESAKSGRGQSPVIGFVLLLALVALGTTAVLVFGSAALADLEDQAAGRRAEFAMTQLDAQAAQVALGSSPVQTVELGSTAKAHRVRITYGGRFVVKTDEGVEILNRTMGAVEYRVGDTVVAYQGGGVWRGTGNESLMVSPPEFSYRDGTVTLPLVVVRPGGGTVAGDRLRVEQGQRYLHLGPGRVTDTQVTVYVTSRYYVGWARFLRQRVPGVTVEVFHHNQTVVAELGHLTIDGDYDTGLVSSGDISIHNGGAVYSEARAGGSVSGSISCDAGSGAVCYTQNDQPDLNELDRVIHRLVADARTDYPHVDLPNQTAPLTAGTYYTDGFLLDGNTVEIDLSAGNVTVFVDGNVGISNGGFRVTNATGTNHYAKLFVTGDVAIAQGESSVTVESGNASRFQLYGTSEMHFAIGQNAVYTGTVYAPRDDPATGSNDAVSLHDKLGAAVHPQCDGYDVCISTGNPQVTGAIVAGSMRIQQAASFTYSEELRHVRPSLPADADFPPPLTNLHISVNEVLISGAPVAGSPPPTLDPGGTPTSTPTADEED